ncbi:allantoinase [Gracilibacillus caseinilyticus]|uniref:Allantoinase n=1 Tax=Gracilibacillus caseinilyticus TaxID=2932256 RepID=A0ABY4F638_9BACI|nr:allantoinase [Gracilibacillus caseinilyticus]UOQ49916.1 allantoinase [Gracilibacillus caseinilyticus]
MNTDYDVILRNGHIVLPESVQKQDIAIKDGKFVCIADSISGTAAQIEDLQENYVFPGAIDVHVHLNEPGRTDWEGFTSGSKMLAAGGMTTFFDMPLNGIPSTTTLAAFRQKNSIAKEKSLIDYRLWGGLVPGNIDNLEVLAEAGVIGYKAFISESGNEEFEAADDMTLLEGMKEIARLGKILALHAESKTITNFLVSEKIALNKRTADDYFASRPIIAEVEAVQRALYYAELTGCSLHFVHISSARAVDKILEAKQSGIDVTVETCPHYLLFSHQDLLTKGAVAKCAPPLRAEQERQKLIALLADNKFDIVASDHSPAPYSLKDPTHHDLFSAWGGISGGQFTLLSMLKLAIENQIPFYRIAKWTASNPAQRFNLKQKGMIAAGFDADFTIIDFERKTIISNDNYYARHKQSIYMNYRFPCHVVQTFSKGKQVYNSMTSDAFLPLPDTLNN